MAKIADLSRAAVASHPGVDQRFPGRLEIHYESLPGGGRGTRRGPRVRYQHGT
jgi:hypothetical protein